MKQIGAYQVEDWNHEGYTKGYIYQLENDDEFYDLDDRRDNDTLLDLANSLGHESFKMGIGQKFCTVSAEFNGTVLIVEECYSMDV